VETIEHDRSHAELARAEIERDGFGTRVRVLEGEALHVLSGLEPGYGFIFWDGDPEQCLAAFEQFLRLLAPGGVLVTSNLFLAQYHPQMPGIADAAAYRERLLREASLRTAFTPSGIAISVRSHG
jgi:predicted O-methyltransferase YrrM